EPNQRLSRDRWYTFKETLPVTISILKDNTRESRSARIEFALGHSDGLIAGTTPDVKLKKDYSIELYWGDAGEVSFGTNQVELQLSDNADRKEQIIDLISKDPLWKFVQFRQPAGMTLRP